MKSKAQKLMDEIKGWKNKRKETYPNDIYNYNVAVYKLRKLRIKAEQMLEDYKEELKFLKKIRKILNAYHSQIPMIEIGRQNVLNDIDNEVKLDERISHLKSEIKILEEIENERR